jgi:hypothetical protein
MQVLSKLIEFAQSIKSKFKSQETLKLEIILIEECFPKSNHKIIFGGKND